MVVPRAVHMARGKTQVIGAQARKKPKVRKDVDIHQYVHEDPAIPTAKPSWTAQNANSQCSVQKVGVSYDR